MCRYDLKLSDVETWSLTLGQFWKLLDKKALETYLRRFDLGAFHLSFRLANFKGKTRLADIIGKEPSLSDQIPVAKTADILAAFKRIFPDGRS